MKIQALKKLVWVVDLIILAAFAFVLVNDLRGANRTKPAGPPEVTPGGKANPASYQATPDEVAQVTGGGVIIPVAPTPLTAAPAVAPVIDLTKDFAYKLVGTIVEATQSFAIFQDSAGAQSLKSIGEAVGNGKVSAIFDDYVVIDINGQKANLYRTQPTPLATTAQVASADSASQTGESSGTEASAETSGEEGEEENPDQMVMSEKAFNDYLKNIGKYTGQITILSHYDDNKKMDGLLLSKVPKTSEAYKRGLREGDIVKQVQDTPVDSTSAALNAIFKVQKDKDYIVDVTIERNGVEEVLTYEIWPE